MQTTARATIPRPGGGRRPIVALAGTLIAVFIVNSLVGLFAIHLAGEAETRDQTTLARLTTALDTAREAQVAFKVQVQEWKNILLRGGDPADYDRYLASFEAHEREVAAHLEALAAVAGDLGVDPAPVRDAITGHAALAARYREGLALFDRAAPGSVAAVDRAVRGIDRPLDESIDAIAATVRARGREVLAAVETTREERHGTLRSVTIASMVIGIALVGAIVVRASLRRD